MTDAKTLAKQRRRAEREQALAVSIATAQAGLAMEARRFPVILADPPWRFEPYSRITGMDRAAENHYPTATLGQIMALVPPAKLRPTGHLKSLCSNEPKSRRPCHSCLMSI